MHAVVFVVPAADALLESNLLRMKSFFESAQARSIECVLLLTKLDAFNAHIRRDVRTLPRCADLQQLVEALRQRFVDFSPASNRNGRDAIRSAPRIACAVNFTSASIDDDVAAFIIASMRTITDAAIATITRATR